MPATSRPHRSRFRPHRGAARTPGLLLPLPLLLGAVAACQPSPDEVLARFEAEHGPFASCGELAGAPEVGEEATAAAADAGGVGTCLLEGWDACAAVSALQRDEDFAGQPLTTRWYLVPGASDCDVAVFREGVGAAGSPWLSRATCDDLLPQPESSAYLPFALERCGETEFLVD